MLYAIVRDMPVSWEDHRPQLERLALFAPAGLLAGAAGRTAEGVRVIEIWRTRDDCERYEGEQIASDEGGGSTVLGDTTVRELLVERLLGQLTAPSSANRKETQ